MRRLGGYNYLTGGLYLTLASVVSAACVFVRNVILARLITLEDYGIASTFALSMALVETVGSLAVDRMIVQTRDGDRPSLLASAHTLLVVRGTLSGLLMFFAAGPIAALFGLPQVVWAFQTMALVPLIRSFIHLDVAVQQRDMRFSASAWMDAGPQVLITVLSVPLALMLKDYRVMIVLILVQATAVVIASHVVAERPYRFAWDRTRVARMLQFGWPLVLNGYLMFAILQGDKAIVGASRGMEALAWYGVAFGLPLVPSLLVVKVLAPLIMPLLARKQDDLAEFERLSMLTVQVCTIAGVVVGLVFVLAGPALLIAMFGLKYAAGTAVIGWFGIMQGARIAKAGPAIVAMARGETTNELLANLVRCLGVAAAVAAVALGHEVTTVAICGMVGEMLGALVAIMLLHWRFDFRVLGMLGCVAVSASLLAGAQWAALRWFHGTSPVKEISGGVVITAVAGAALIAAYPHVTSLTRRVTSDLRAASEAPLARVRAWTQNVD